MHVCVVLRVPSPGPRPRTKTEGEREINFYLRIHKRREVVYIFVLKFFCDTCFVKLTTTTTSPLILRKELSQVQIHPIVWVFVL